MHIWTRFQFISTYARTTFLIYQVHINATTLHCSVYYIFITEISQLNSSGQAAKLVIGWYKGVTGDLQTQIKDGQSETAAVHSLFQETLMLQWSYILL